MRVERAQRVGHRRVARQREIEVEALRLHQRDHVLRHRGRALRIEVGGERVFVDQALEPRQLAVQLGAGQQRRQ